jgi:hypothetical protein
MTITRSQLRDGNFWQGRAEEARAMAEMLSEPKAKEALLHIADGYDVLARGARAVKSGKSKSGK